MPSTTAARVVAIDVQSHAYGALGAPLFATALAAGERVYGQPVVSGNDLFILSSFGALGGSISASFGDAGKLRRMSLTGGAITSTTALTKGQGEVAVASDGSVVASSDSGETAVSNAAVIASGLSLGNAPQKPVTPQLWLDLR